MSDRVEQLEWAAELAKRLPDGVFFAIKCYRADPIQLGIQAHTLDEVQEVKKALKLHGSWKRRTYAKKTTWMHTTHSKGIRVQIYACEEAPPHCKPIKETRVRKKKVPVEWEELEAEEEEVIVGWDCSGED